MKLRNEEPKEYWYICSTRDYEITMVTIDDGTDFDRVQKDKEIGNYFETYEEAEKALEKLKAYKRLKDAEFKFKGYEEIWGETDDGASGGEGKIDFAILGKFNPKDLDLLFGGKE